MEDRLKQDLLKEAKKFNNILLIHDELGILFKKFTYFLENGDIIPVLIYANHIATSKEIFTLMDNIVYTRLPIYLLDNLEDEFMDTFLNSITLINQSSSDKWIFNCGMGASRTTFGMIVACLVKHTLYKTPILKSKSSIPPRKNGGDLDRTQTKSDVDRDTNAWIDEVESPYQKVILLKLTHLLERGMIQNCY